MSDMHRKMLLSNNPALRLPPKIPVQQSHHHHGVSSSGTAAAAKRGPKDYSLLPWTNYFDRMRDIELENGDRFRVYIKGNQGPVFLFLHGGGFSGLTWAVLSETIVKKIECQCYGLDIRGHGDTHTSNDLDLSIDTMADDVKRVLNAIWPDATSSPPIVLVGHSMGGALAVHAASQGCVDHLIGLVVIDVVEGSAMEALASMQSFLQGRPKFFNSLEQAVEYSVRSGAIKNVESARVSLVGQLRKCEKTNQSSDAQEDILDNVSDLSHAVMQTEIAEEDENAIADSEAQASSKTSPFKTPELPPKNSEKYEWRIDLTKTEVFWKDWFKGLSSKFLSVPVPKLLLLAGVDRLDKELMVGQMQGKFQMQVLPLCGHAVHEDAPEDVSDALANFMIRHKFAQPLDQINPPRLSC